MKQACEIDARGFMTGEVIVIEPVKYDEKESPVYDIPRGYIDVPLPFNESGQLPFFRPRWTGTAWVEDKTQVEFEEDDFLKSLIPSKEELADADIEIKTILLLMEMEVI
ncbi:hypothetical protein [Psychrobacillus sp.]|uniref:hypothetical protein n=1 Tax=Psychrobacillus sp. TaxID=1871623 RepID=UPI0028BE41CE|nr:hypothetical protein [Psychrobacillus sp.]